MKTVLLAEEDAVCVRVTPHDMHETCEKKRLAYYERPYRAMKVDDRAPRQTNAFSTVSLSFVVRRRQQGMAQVKKESPGGAKPAWKCAQGKQGSSEEECLPMERTPCGICAMILIGWTNTEQPTPYWH